MRCSDSEFDIVLHVFTAFSKNIGVKNISAGGMFLLVSNNFKDRKLFLCDKADVKGKLFAKIV